MTSISSTKPQTDYDLWRDHDAGDALLFASRTDDENADTRGEMRLGTDTITGILRARCGQPIAYGRWGALDGEAAETLLLGALAAAETGFPLPDGWQVVGCYCRCARLHDFDCDSLDC